MTNWRLRGVCRNHDPEIWFPHQGDKATRKQALRLCRDCPVIRECREHALRTAEPDGIWGGLTQSQRSKILGVPAKFRRALRDPLISRTRLAPCGTPAAYKRHRRNDETPCGPCRAAISIEQTEFQRRRRAQAAPIDTPQPDSQETTR